MKMTVLYHTKSGNTKQMAEVIARGMNAVEGAQAKAFSIEQIDADWLQESRCLVYGTPTYYADVSGATKAFLETCMKYGPTGKLGGAFATADYLHGGGDLAIQTVLTHMMVYGMLVYSGGGGCGAPVIHLGPVALKDHLAQSEETFEIYGRRMAAKALELFGEH